MGISWKLTVRVWYVTNLAKNVLDLQNSALNVLTSGITSPQIHAASVMQLNALHVLLSLLVLLLVLLIVFCVMEIISAIDVPTDIKQF
jgi:hypothetical protein